MSETEIASLTTALDGLTRRVGAVETMALGDLTRRVAAVETTALGDLTRRVAALETTANDLPTQIAGALIPPGDHHKLAYEHAAQWLRMVNTITWTLSSLYLAVAIVALNTVRDAPKEWKHTIGWTVFGLCCVWFCVDVIYAFSSLKARSILTKIEADTAWPAELKLYTWQAQWTAADGSKEPIILLWLLSGLLVYVPIAGMAFLSLTLFAWAP
jgi:hypothetical protein